MAYYHNNSLKKQFKQQYTIKINFKKTKTNYKFNLKLKTINEFGLPEKREILIIILKEM